MLHTSEYDAEHTCLDFSGAAGGRRRGGYSWGGGNFGVCITCVSGVVLTYQIWSIRFSADGQEVVAGGGSGRIMVYDIEAQRRSLSITGHTDDGQCFLVRSWDPAEV
jgi:WD repeat-containing protein 23